MSASRALLCAFLAIPLISELSEPSLGQQEAAAGGQIIQQENQRIAMALGETHEWHFLDVTLAEVVDVLKERLDVNILLDVRALEDYGIGSDTPVTVQIEGVSVRSLLNLTLRDLDLDWRVREGVLIISTPEALESQLVTQAYPVDDLARLGGANGIYDYDSLIAAMTRVVAPDSWDSVGGPGAIQAIYGSLVVSQVRDVHDRVAQVLDGLRQFLPAEGAEPSEGSHAILGDSAAERNRTELEEPTEFDFMDTTLQEVAEYVVEYHDIPVVIDSRALDDFGIGTGLPITFQLVGLPFRTSLDLLLENYGLTYAVTNEVLMVTTSEEAEGIRQGAQPVAL